ASEWDNAGGRNSPASWSPTECATKPLWEACLQANGTTPEVGIRQQAGLPQSVPRSRCGKLACKRMGQRQRPVFASKLVSHRVCHEAAVGSLLASEWDNAGGRNAPAGWLLQIVLRSRCGSLPASEWANIGGRDSP